MSKASTLTADHRAATNTDAWHKVPSDRTVARESRTVPWAEVKPSAHSAAERHLAAVDFVRVSREEATDYATTPLQVGDGDQCYLLRGLYLNRGTGRFSVGCDGRNLYVHHGSLGRRAVPMKRQPLLVALPEAPEQVYVDVSMAE